ncbi:MAG: TauD/TfdA family dioxygenase [Sphingomonas sp.]|nr:TauD/TfdA family dioxygenase [Sphingomonas sp.]
MPDVELPSPGRPYVLLRPAAERGINDLDAVMVADLYKAHGALLFRGFRTDVDQFRRFTGTFCPTYVVNQSAGRQPIDPAHNIHSVDPGTRSFDFHSELSREPWAPDVAFFACLSSPAQGGATTICDGVQLVREMPDGVREGLSGRRLLHLKPTWPEMLRFWLGDPDPDDGLLASPPSWCPYAFERRNEGVICSFSRPALNRPMFTDQPAFANFVLFARFTRNRRNYPLLDDESPIPESWLQEIKGAAGRIGAEVSWERGDVLMLDNSRFMHGRTAIIDPAERLIGTFFGYLGFAIPDAEEPPCAPWRQADFAPPPGPHERR